jgi:hypothetical protein
MIIKGGSRKSGQFFARHLMKAEENERVEIKEMRGLYADDLKEAFREMRLIASGTGCTNYFYHVSLNPREDESLTHEQWEYAVERLEQNLGLEGHARVQVEHEKKGRTHRHIVWSRIDPDTMTATSDSYNYLIHNKTREELEQTFDHQPTPPPHERGTRIRDWEYWRAQESGIGPRDIKAEVTELWKISDSGPAFQAALEEAGYTLCRGDKRDFCIVDQAGDVHSLGRRIEGVRAADIRQRMAGIDHETLLSVKEATYWVKSQDPETRRHKPEEHTRQQETVTTKEPSVFVNPKLRVLDRLAREGALAETSDTYHIATSAEQFAQMSESRLRSEAAAPPSTGGEIVDEERHAWETLRPRAANASEKEKQESDELWQESVTRSEDRENERDEPERER